jgi:hypothetical protein
MTVKANASINPKLKRFIFFSFVSLVCIKNRQNFLNPTTFHLAYEFGRWKYTFLASPPF